MMNGISNKNDVMYYDYYKPLVKGGFMFGTQINK